MEFLSDGALIDAYNKAIEMKLEEDFIVLLTSELNRRNLLIIPKSTPPIDSNSHILPLK